MPSTKSLCNISVYGSGGEQVCYTDSTGAHGLVARGDHEWFCVSCGKVKGEGPCLVRTNHLMAVREVLAEVLDDSTLKPRPESDRSLTRRDMERNVGITQGYPGEPPLRGQVRAARTRIRYWGAASLGFPGKPGSGNRAITIVPRGTEACAR